jgi:hypothetical protein
MASSARSTIKARKDQAVRLSGWMTYTLVPSREKLMTRQVRAGACMVRAR